MHYNYIDEVALLKAFIDNKSLSYTEVQEKGIVPLLNKQDRRALFKNTIDKFKRWEVIEAVPDSDPKTWNVVLDKATIEYNKLKREIEQQNVIEKYSFESLQTEVTDHSRKLVGIKMYRVLAVSAFALAAFQFITGLSLMGLFGWLKLFIHNILRHAH